MLPVLVAQAAFVLLVILIPVGFGVGWSEHNKTRELERLQQESYVREGQVAWDAYDAQLDACKHENEGRRATNKVIVQINKYSQDVFVQPLMLLPCRWIIVAPDRPRAIGRGLDESHR